jgi:hypothetical protein
MELRAWPVVLSMALLTYAMPAHAGISTGCGEAAPKPAAATGTWGPADVPLFSLSSSGELSKFGFDGRPRTVLATHGFVPGYGGSDISADGRWLLYDGQRQQKSEYWLFDTRTGRDRHLLTRPQWGSGVVAFSQDGRHAALYSNHDPRTPDLAGAGLYLIDLESETVRHIGLPPAAKANDFGAPYWSSTGELYIRVNADKALSYHVSSEGDFRRVESRFERQAPAFTDGGRRIELADVPRMQSDQGQMTSSSPDARHTASIDGDTYELTVHPAKGLAYRVARGSYDQCEGITILIHGWPNDRFLVFSIGWSDYYLHDVEQRRTRRLFASELPDVQFFWPTPARH